MTDSAYLEALGAICQPMRAADMPRSLTPMRCLLSELGYPHHRFPSMVVTGSVGKGTTCHQLSRSLYLPSDTALSLSQNDSRQSLLSPRPEGEAASDSSERGVRVGIFTGPHLHSFRERFQVNDEQISQAEFVDCAAIVRAAIPRIHDTFTTFEMATALALVWFARRGVDIAVLEVGIGGRWDAVNVVENVLAVFTPIEREHVDMLGGSLQTIAWHKAGIIQPGGYALSVRQSPEVEAILSDVAEQERAKLTFVDEQQLLARAVHSLVDRGVVTIPSLNKRTATESPALPGRLECLEVAGRKVLIDGGHTPASARRLLAEIDSMIRFIPDPNRIDLVVGMLGDKSAREFLAVFDSPHFCITLTTASSHRAILPHELAARANLRHASVQIVSDLSAALAQVQTGSERLLVIAGSLRMAAAAREAYGLLIADELAEAQATRAIFEGEDYLSRLRHFG